MAIKEFRLLSRAVFVVDATDTVVYAEYVPAIEEQPDYEAVIVAAKAAEDLHRPPERPSGGGPGEGCLVRARHA